MKALSIESEVENYIKTQYKQGERLPSERDLSIAINRSRNVVRSVLQKLIEQKYITVESPRTRIVSANTDQKTNGSNVIGLIGYGELLKSNHPESLSMDDKRKFGTLKALEQVQHMGLIIPNKDLDSLQENFNPNMLQGLIYFNFSNVFYLREKIKTYFRPNMPIVSFADNCLISNYENRFFNTVSSNHELGGELLIESIAKKGGKNILYINTTGYIYFWEAERKRGMLKASQKLNVKFTEIVSIDNREDHHDIEMFNFCAKIVAKNIHEIFYSETPPDSIIVNNDGILPLIVKSLEILGIDYNKIILAGYDNTHKINYSLLGRTITPDITVDKQDVLIGEKAVELLLKRIAGELEDRLYNYTIDPILIDNHIK